MSYVDDASSAELPSDLLLFTPNVPVQQLEDAAAKLGQTHLALQNAPGRIPLHLTMCESGVPVGCFTLTRPDSDVHVSAMCIVKTGSANSYLSHDILHLLGYDSIAVKYEMICQGENQTFRRRQRPDAPSIIGVNFLKRHCVRIDREGGLIYDRHIGLAFLKRHCVTARNGTRL